MKKEQRLILEASPCDTNLYPDGPQTIAEARNLGKSMCPFFSKCNNHGLAEKGLQCVMSFGVNVAQYAIQERHTVDKEMADFRKELAGQFPQTAANGFIWSKDREEFEIIKDIEEGISKIAEFAKTLLGECQSDNSTETAEKEGRSFEQLLRGAMNPEGAIDLRKIEALEGSCGYNGGRGCDVTSGPCSCGAWH